MSLVFVLIYLWLRQLTDQLFDYLHHRLQKPQPKQKPSAIGFAIPDTVEEDEVFTE